MKKIRITTFGVLLILTTFSCKKFLDVGPPSNQIASATIFQSEETATAAINGLYTYLANGNLYFAAGGTTVYLGVYGDEFYYTGTTITIQEFANSKLSIGNSYVALNFWSRAYQIINQTNSCIAGLNRSNISPTVKTQLLGEAYFIRAFCFYSLVKLFGDVPLVLTADDYQGVSDMSRTSSVEVQDQIFADLQQAKQRLSPTYPTTGRYRVNYYSVLAFLARVYSDLGMWNEALTNSNEVIAQTATYGLENDLNKAFLTGSTEAIWQTASDLVATNTYEGSQFIPLPAAALRPTYTLQPDLHNAFTANDKRKSNWITIKTVSGVQYPYPTKYKVKSNSVKTEAQIMIRLAEIYLIRAEAKAHRSDPTAIDDLNKTRVRAGLLPLSGLSGQPLLDAIIQERRLELFAEWGLRWFDLKRLGKLDQTMSLLKPDWISTATLFPIPNSEIMSAPNLRQNPGYN